MGQCVDRDEQQCDRNGHPDEWDSMVEGEGSDFACCVERSAVQTPRGFRRPSDYHERGGGRLGGKSFVVDTPLVPGLPSMPETRLGKSHSIERLERSDGTVSFEDATQFRGAEVREDEGWDMPWDTDLWVPHQGQAKGPARRSRTKVSGWPRHM